MAWVFLGIAIACEVLATTALKLSNGFSHAWWTAASIGGYGLAFVMLSFFGENNPFRFGLCTVGRNRHHNRVFDLAHRI